MPRFQTKKPVHIDATQWHKHGDHVAVMPVPALRYDELSGEVNYDPDRFGWIVSLSGEYLVSPGDWIICGVQGEFYPCKADVFAATYEPA